MWCNNKLEDQCLASRYNHFQVPRFLVCIVLFCWIFMFQTYDVTLQLTQLIWVSWNNRGLTQWKMEKKKCRMQYQIMFRFLSIPSFNFVCKPKFPQIFVFWRHFTKHKLFFQFVLHELFWHCLCCMGLAKVLHNSCGLKAKVFMLEKMFKSMFKV
jgi:hypothetical protein